MQRTFAPECRQWERSLRLFFVFVVEPNRRIASSGINCNMQSNISFIGSNFMDSGKQFSLDSRMDLVFHGMDARKRSEDGSQAITEDGEETWEGTKGRYC